MEIITKQEAVDKGLVRYFSGKPCRFGHTAQRYTKSGCCAECNRLYMKSFCKTESFRATNKRYNAHYNETPAGKATKRKSSFKQKYGLTLEQHEQMIANQDNKCAICKNEFVGVGRVTTSPCVDHCHATTKLRGILCGKCNKLLGHANDSIDTLQNAINYLIKHS